MMRTTPVFTSSLTLPRVAKYGGWTEWKDIHRVWVKFPVQRLSCQLLTLGDIGSIHDGESWLASVLPDVQAQWTKADVDALEFSLLRLVSVGGDGTQVLDEGRMERLRENWEPFISQLILFHAERGDIQKLLH